MSIKIVPVRKSIPSWEEFQRVFSEAQYLDEVLGLLHASNQPWHQSANHLDDSQRAVSTFYISVFRQYFEAYKLVRTHQVEDDRNSMYYLAQISFQSLRSTMKLIQGVRNLTIKEDIVRSILDCLAMSDLYWLSMTCQEEPLKKEIHDFLEARIKLHDEHPSVGLPTSFYRAAVLSGNVDLLRKWRCNLIEARAQAQKCINEWRRSPRNGLQERPSLRGMLTGTGWAAKAMSFLLNTSDGTGETEESLECALEEIVHEEVVNELSTRIFGGRSGIAWTKFDHGTNILTTHVVGRGTWQYRAVHPEVAEAIMTCEDACQAESIIRDRLHDDSDTRAIGTCNSVIGRNLRECCTDPDANDFSHADEVRWTQPDE